MDAWDQELDSWEEAVEKTINVEAKALLQSSSSTRKIDSKCPQENKPAKKEEKNFAKNKSIDSAHADILSEKQSSSTNQTFSVYLNKNQIYYRGPVIHSTK